MPAIALTVAGLTQSLALEPVKSAYSANGNLLIGWLRLFQVIQLQTDRIGS